MGIKFPTTITFTGKEVRNILVEEAVRKIGITLEKFDKLKVTIKLNKRNYENGNGEAVEITFKSLK